MRLGKRNHRGGRRSASSSRAPPAALRTPHGARFAARPSVSGDVAVHARRHQAQAQRRDNGKRLEALMAKAGVDLVKSLREAAG